MNWKAQMPFSLIMNPLKKLLTQETIRLFNKVGNSNIPEENNGNISNPTHIHLLPKKH